MARDPLTPPAVLAHSVVGDGPPVLLVHGLGACRQDWRDVQPALAAAYRTVAVDLSGYGDSPRRPGGLSPDDHARDLVATMDALGLPRVSVIGHSMGGAVSMALALRHPERVEALVLANCVSGFRPQRARELYEVGMRLAMMAVLGPRRLGVLMAQRMFPHPHQDAERQLIIARTANNRRSTYLRSLMALCRWSARGHLHTLRMPALVIASGNDYFPVEDVRELADEIPNAEFALFPEARHGLPLEEGVAMAARIDAFLSGHAVGRDTRPAKSSPGPVEA